MTSLMGALPYIQIVLSILLVIAILMQKSEANVGGAFGGNDNFASGFHTRRGFEKNLFYFSLGLAVLFAISCVLALVLR